LAYGEDEKIAEEDGHWRFAAEGVVLVARFLSGLMTDKISNAGQSRSVGRA
jgi:hypothetical protein